MNSEKQRVVVVGGGVAALEAALGLHWEECIDTHVTLIAEAEEFVYRPLAVLEPFGYGMAPHFPIAEILHGAIDELIIAKIANVDTTTSSLTTSDGATIEFDAAVVATGAEATSWLENSIVVGTPAAMESMAILVAKLDAGMVDKIAFVVPEGASWTLPMYELAMFTADRARRRLHHIEVNLLIPDAKPLIQFGQGASDNVNGLLREVGVNLITSATGVSYNDQRLQTRSGRQFDTKFVVAVPQLHGAVTPGLPHSDDDGFLPVDDYGLVVGTTNIYAAGDVTNFPIKQGGIASQQADVVVGAITEQFGERANPHAFEPELRGLLLSHRGKTSMRAIVGGHDDALQAISKQSLQALTEKIYSRHLTSRIATLMATQATAG